jgi:hypothetical protein
MQLTRRRWTAIAGAIIALGVIGLVVAQLVVDASENHEGSNLLVETRSRLSVCVDSVAGSPETDLVSRISDALNRALAGRTDVPREFFDNEVVGGCPPPVPLTGNRLEWLYLCCEYPKRVSEPEHVSEQLLNVYVVSDAAYAASFGQEVFVRAPGEFLCARPVSQTVQPDRAMVGLTDNPCTEVTVSLYMPDSTDGATMERALLSALAVSDMEAELPTPDWSVCAAGTPALHCSLYTSCQDNSQDADCKAFWEELRETDRER